MCGRFTQKTDISKLAKELGIPEAMIPPLGPRYNIAPSDPIAVLLEDRNKKVPRIDLMNWGLIPSWAKDSTIGNGMINARAETLSEKPSFQGPFKNSRCLVVADGFYEWKRESKTKQPYYFRLKNQNPFTFAGLWSHWASSDGSEILSCAIITTEANLLVKSVHHRMPVIIPQKSRAEWLDTSHYEAKQLNRLLGPYPDEAMETYPVSTVVNSPTNDVAACMEPVQPNLNERTLFG